MPPRKPPAPQPVEMPPMREAHWPEHYEAHPDAPAGAEMEASDALLAALGVHGFATYAQGVAFYYLWRAGRKTPSKVGDFTKAIETLTLARDALLAAGE
jgi:hypothetical protein